MASGGDNGASMGESKAPISSLVDPQPLNSKSVDTNNLLGAEAPQKPTGETTTGHAMPIGDLLQPTNGLNGDATLPVSNGTLKEGPLPVDPVSDMPNSVQPAAAFLPDRAAISDPYPSAGTVAVAVEAPTSDMRADPLPAPAEPPLHRSTLSDLDVGVTKQSDGKPASSASPSRANEDTIMTSEPPAPKVEDTPAVPSVASPSRNSAEQSAVVEAKSEPTGAMSPAHGDGAAASTRELPLPSSTDQEMADAPSPAKLSRAREEEDEVEPTAKRTKTEEGVSSEATPVPASETETGATLAVSAPADHALAATAPSVPIDTDTIGAPKPEQMATETAPPVQPLVAEDEGTFPRVPAGLPEAKTFETKPLTKPQSKQLLHILRTAKKIKAAKWFTKPVDWQGLGLPSYPEYIKRPMDLSTVEQNFKDEKYISLNDFMVDIYQIVDNCRCFNGPGHVATQAAYSLLSYIEESLSRLPGDGATESAQAAKKQPKRSASQSQQSAVKIAPPRRESTRAAAGGQQSPTSATATSPQTTYALQPDGMPLIRRESMNTDGRPKREIHRPPPRDAIYSSKPRKKKFAQELKFCDTIVSEIFKGKNWGFAHPFLQPVDPIALNLPNYHSVVKKPMDFSTIKQDLDNGNIETAKQFHQASKLVFENCYKFNPSDNPVHQAGKQLEAMFDELWAAKDQWMADHAPVSEPQSPGTESSDDEASEVEEEMTAEQRQARIMEIHAEVAKLNSEVQELMFPTVKAKKTGEKRKKGTKGAGKGAGTSKGKRSGAGATAKDGKSSKPKKTKTHPVSFEEKQEISESINTLNDGEMRRAVQIIRNGVPSLKDVNDDEMELDIDTIPDPVLSELLKFLRSVRPKPGRGASTVAVPAVTPQAHHGGLHDDDYEPPRGKPSGSSRPRKNKPMNKQQQEASIQAIQNQLEMFEQGQGGDLSMVDIGQNDESSDDESASESEEE